MQFHENQSSGSRVVPRRRTDGWTNGRTWRSQQLFFKILRTRLNSGPHRPNSQKSETHWKQGVTLVGRRQGKDNYTSHISFSAVLQPNSGQGCLTVEVSRSRARTHTHTHARARQDSSGRVISSLQRPLPTQQTQQKNIRVLSKIRTYDPGSTAAADLSSWPHGHLYRHMHKWYNLLPQNYLLNYYNG
jgi:hypothetical protein